MDADLLVRLGQVAGIGGIALGVFLLLFRQIISKFVLADFSEQNSFRIIRLTLFLVWSIAIFGIGVWALIELTDKKTYVSDQEQPRVLVQGVDGFSSYAEGCAPVIKASAASRETYLTLDMRCDLDADDIAIQSRASINEVLRTLRFLSMAQSYYFLPTFKAYEDDPSDQKWQRVLEEVENTKGLIDASRHAVLAYASTLPLSEETQFLEIHRLLHDRSQSLLFFLMTRVA